MKHVKLFEEFINDKSVNEELSHEALSKIAEIIASGVVALIAYLLPVIWSGIKAYASNVKDMINPGKYTRFTNELSKDNSFNKKFLQLLVKHGGTKGKKYADLDEFGKDIVESAEFKKILDKYYPNEDYGISYDRNDAIREFKIGIKTTIEKKGSWIIDTIKKKFPEVKDMQVESEEFVTEKSGDSYNHGCVMLYFDFPKMNDIHSKIDENDLYEEENDRTYGLEDEPHITLLYGLEKEVTPQQIKEILDNFTFGPCKLYNASLFENEYDVLKFDVGYPTKGGAFLHKCNTALRELPYQNDYPDYHPHMTIGYLKKGIGKKYTEMLKDQEYDLTPTHAVFSQPDGTKTKMKINVNE